MAVVMLSRLLICALLCGQMNSYESANGSCHTRSSNSFQGSPLNYHQDTATGPKQIFGGADSSIWPHTEEEGGAAGILMCQNTDALIKQYANMR